MKLVYVCSPYRGTDEQMSYNKEFAIRASRYVVEQGEAPVAPHLFVPEYMTDGEDWETTNKTLMDKCDELWVFGKTISNGMQAEIDYFKGAIKYIERI